MPVEHLLKGKPKYKAQGAGTHDLPQAFHDHTPQCRLFCHFSNRRFQTHSPTCTRIFLFSITRKTYSTMYSEETSFFSLYDVGFYNGKNAQEIFSDQNGRSVTCDLITRVICDRSNAAAFGSRHGQGVGTKDRTETQFASLSHEEASQYRNGSEDRNATFGRTHRDHLRRHRQSIHRVRLKRSARAPKARQ